MRREEAIQVWRDLTLELFRPHDCPACAVPTMLVHDGGCVLLAVYDTLDIRRGHELCGIAWDRGSSNAEAGRSQGEWADNETRRRLQEQAAERLRAAARNWWLSSRLSIGVEPTQRHIETPFGTFSRAELE